MSVVKMTLAQLFSVAVILSGCAFVSSVNGKTACSTFEQCVAFALDQIDNSHVPELALIPGPYSSLMNYHEAWLALKRIMQEIEQELNAFPDICYRSSYHELVEYESCSYLIVFDALRRYQGHMDTGENIEFVTKYTFDLVYFPFNNDSCMDIERASSEQFELMIDGFYRLAWVNVKCSANQIFLRDRGWISSQEIESCMYFEIDETPDISEQIILKLCDPISERKH